MAGTSGRKPRKSGGSTGSGGEQGRPSLADVERWTFRGAARGLYLFAFGALVFIGLASDLLYVAALASIAVFLWAAVALPTKGVKATGRYLWSGEAGDDAHRLWNRILPWRTRNGGR